MTNAEKLTLAKHACHIRMGVIEGTHSAKCGHPGGSLDIAEVLSYLYFVDMNIDPKEPKKPDRDRFVLSKGHAAPALYATLAERGFFPVEDLKTLRKIGDYDQIESAIKAFHAENDKPTCIILDTVKGTGVSFMTNSVDWHGKGPNDEEYAVAMQELNAAYAALEQEDK